MNKSNNIETIYPLSPLQQGILFHATYDPESDAYFEQLSCSIHGDLNVEALRRAWQAVVDRHSILRTGFFWQRRETPLQVVLRRVRVPWDQHDWRSLSLPEQERRLDDYLDADRKRGFELSKAPLMRVSLIRRGDNSYYLVWSHHHLLLDGWSVPLVLKEVFSFYDAFSHDRDIDSGRSNPYQEYITWLRKQDKAKADEFWRKSLEGFTTPTPLPIERKPEASDGQRESYYEQQTTLTAEVTAALRLKAQQHSLTLNTLALGSWALLLSCYSGRNDVLFGSVVSGRPGSLPGVESMVGLFVNTLPVRIQITPEATLLDWLKRLQEQQSRLRQYEYSSLVDIQGVSPIRRGTPLFESIFVFENYPIQSASLQNGNIEIADIRIFERTDYPLTVSVVPGPDLTLYISYDRRLFDDKTIREMLAGLQNLVEGVLIYPETCLADLLSATGLDRNMPTVSSAPTIDRTIAKRSTDGTGELSLSPASPQTRAAEELIAAVWSEVLGLEQVTVHDNFFELGGHSLLAMRVISRLQDVFQCELPVKLIFESPTVAGLARKIESLRMPPATEKPATSDQSLSVKEYPLSFSQQRLWFIDQLEPGNSAYNLPEAIRIMGPLSVGALSDCLCEISRRHEVLRTTFDMTDGRLVQVVGQAAAVAIGMIDLSGIAEGCCEEAARRIISAEAAKPFDLRRGPLMRAALLKVNEQEHLVLFTMHHIVADAWSEAALVQEVGELYKAFVVGNPSMLPDLPVQYGDFAVWQRQLLHSGALEVGLSYWKQQLAGAPAVLQLSPDRPRPRVQSYRGASVSVVPSESLTEQLKLLSRQKGVTLFVTLLTAFKVLLMRYSGEQDIVVGVPVVGRPRAEFDGLIGFFVNNLAIRSKLTPDAGFLDAITREQEAVLGALAHQDVPFEKVVDELQPERSLSHSPVFQVAFNFLALPDKRVSLGELSLSPVEFEVETSKYDLVLAVSDTDRTLVIELCYSTDLFNQATIERMLAHFQALLQAAVKDSASPISMLPLLSAAERRHLLVDRNQTHAHLAADLLIHHLVEKRTTESPDAVALTYENLHVSYGELNRRANQLAHHLQTMGMGPESMISVFMERSPDVVIAAVAILKAGGAYVPIDPSSPVKRISFMLEDTQAEVLLTQQELAHRLPKSHARVILIDSDWSDIATCSDQNPVSEVVPDNLAYVIYTSGSTGQPKGVMVAHRGLCNLAQAQIRAFDVRASSRVLQFAPFVFDASVSEVFTALSEGATLCLAGQQQLLPGAELIELMRDEQITVATLPPTVLATLAEERLPTLRSLIAAGEACSADIVRWWASGRRFLNAYGPTESTVCATIAEINDSNRKVTIGRPIQNTQIYLLDGQYEPLPDGVVGEIYIGGIGLARGYLNRPDLTAERFIPNPFTVETGARLYKTADLARYLHDDIEYIGRADHQVKVRGYRIELGEIEQNLKEHPSVAEAVAVTREVSINEKRIVAYVVASHDTAVETTKLRSHLAARLPEYMLPHYLITLDELPSLPNGKIDRRALPPPQQGRPKPEDTYQPPRTELEALLVRMWQDILEIERIGVFDQFFETGGDSISGAIFINKLQEVLKEVVYVVALFDAPTIAELADYLRQNYPEAVARVCGDRIITTPKPRSEKIDAIKVAAVRELIRSQSTTGQAEVISQPKAPSAIFILSPPRSGSTLLRAMLAGHPRLFAPPELELLSFRTLEERREVLSGRNSFWKEGVVRALMEIKGCDAEEGRLLIEQFENTGMSTKQFYRQMQEWLVERVLVDKTPSYALDIEVLRRAEKYFDNPVYIHLLRHPCGMIASFVEAKLEQVFFRYDHDFTRRELAELIWLISQQNIVDFLAAVPKERQFCLKFEDLVRQPKIVTERLSEFIGIDPHDAMLEPYDGHRVRMTDGIHDLSRMIGDIKFHEHHSVDESVADRWRETHSEEDLGELTRDLAEKLGYKRPLGAKTQPAPSAEFSTRSWLSIEPVPRNESTKLPLSFAQQRLWFINRLDPDSPLYNIPLVVRITGTLDVAVFKKAINEIVRRHEVLRTSFVVMEGQPVQVIAPKLTLKVELIDLRSVDAEEREMRMRDLVEEESSKPFDLMKGPPLRASLVRLSDNEHVVTIVMHHVVSDERSVQIFVSEMAALFEAFRDGQPSPLAELPIQYADFAAWQRQWLQDDILQGHLSYWRCQLDGAPAVLRLPTDRLRPAAQSYRGSSVSLVLDEALADRARLLARQEGLTLFVTMLAAFNVLLMRYSGEQDLVVGVPVAGRTRAQVEELIGFFINALVIRTRVEPDWSFLYTLGRVKEVALGAFTHQDLPFEKLVEELQPERSLSHSPLFQVAFNYLNQSDKTFSLRELSFSAVDFEVGTAKYDLVFAVVESGKDLSLHVRYNTDLFDRTTIEQILTHFEVLLEGAVADPAGRISGLPLLTPAEMRQLIDRSGTTRPLATNLLIHNLVEKQAGQSPGAVALTYESGLRSALGAHASLRAIHVTYDELNRRANRLANYLREMGIGPETIVGILMKSSPDMIVAMLGVMKAGGAYLPLDPEYPARRLAAIIEDSSLPLLITQQDLEDRLPAYAGQVVILDNESERIESFSDLNPASSVIPENLAYVIYTSGSTGKPKGVLLTHRGLLNLVFWHLSAFNVTDSDRATQVAGVGFDACVWEIWPYLAVGSSLSIAEESIRTSAMELQNWLLSNQTTISFLATPLAEHAIVLDWPVDSSLRILLTGGDKLHHHPATELPFTLVNNYGPTENTVVTTSGIVEETQGPAYETPSIGRPVSNSQAYVLSRELELTPLRVAGELHIGGASLARGYLLDADFTAQKFIPDPFSDEPGARLYKSGDLARLRTDGTIDFLGRIDDQVKVRGFRIEPGDIEAALARFPKLMDAVVLAREDAPGESRLVAYVVCDPGQQTSIGEMRAYLKEKLPEYMVPTAFVMLDALPLTPNGKVDRNVLPAPDYTQFYSDEDRIAPRTDLERFLARKWSEVLGVAEIGIYDNFFDIGGESLKAAVLINNIQQELGEMLQVVTVFDAPSIAAFAAYLSKHCPDAVARLTGAERSGVSEDVVAKIPLRKVDQQRIEEMRRLIVPLPPRKPQHASSLKNPPAIFILSSPRSGSTLLRVILGGHPLLFAPPELELLSFNTLTERRTALSGRDSFWQEGAIRAVMEIKQCAADEARRIIEECEVAGMSTQQFFRMLQGWLGDRILVDKTPSYAMDPEVLERAETDFDDALYIHLVRSPQGMIHSYEEAKLDQIFPRFKHSFPVTELAEIVWVISHQNILDFLGRVPPRRKYRVLFEDLIRESATAVEGICRFLGIDLHPDMRDPYRNEKRRMTDGIHKESRMLGDIKFHQHSAIDPKVADSWREYFKNDFLGDETWRLAELLGYVRPQPDSIAHPPRKEVFASIQQAPPEPGIERMLAQLNSLSEEQVDSLLNQMLNEVHGH